MELGPDILGTTPQQPHLPSIVDHSWLDVDLSKYDNYPSDNNPVRVVPKLNQLWNHSMTSTGTMLIPNSQVMPLGVRSSDEDTKAVTQICREAKKAAMLGLKGKALSQHLRARFSSRQLVLAAEELKKISEEIGLIGNVYIDASAFNTYEEAESFLRQHRNRLAKNILINSDTMSPNALSMLASAFHKNVAASVEYTPELLKQYRDHLVEAGKIPKDFVVDSKETLRNAFLYEKAPVVVEEVKKEAKKLDPKQMEAGLEEMAMERAIRDVEASDSMNLSRITPVVSFVQENLAKGKKAVWVKDMLRSRFVMDDVKVASQALIITLSKDGLTSDHIDGLIKEGKVTDILGSELKRIGKKFLIKEKFAVEEPKVERAVGVLGHFHVAGSGNVSSKNSTYREAALNALKKGIEPERIKAKLIEKKLSSSEANQVLVEAVSLLNAAPAGTVANKKIKTPKVALVPEPAAPDRDLALAVEAKSIVAQTKEITSYFEGSNMTVDIDSPVQFDGLEIGELFNREGLDKAL